MKIADIQQQLIAAKDRALVAMGVSEDIAAQIALAPAPDPAMGDVGFPCFALARTLRKGPPQIARELAETIPVGGVIAEVVPAGPYVNFRLSKPDLAAIVGGQALAEGARFGVGTQDQPEKWMIEFSAPNTNKPQHLGHVRNNLLGATVSSVLAFAGHDVVRVNLINDRGIHICKSMLSYQLWGEGATPESTGIKGDHFVGNYYVLFGEKLDEEYAAWAASDAADAAFQAWRRVQSAKSLDGLGADEIKTRFLDSYGDTYFNQHSILGAQTKKMLIDWEAGEPSVVELWETMNSWVFAGFDETYERLGITFDRVYRESQTYLLGKDIVLDALAASTLRQLDDGAIVFDLDQIGLDGQKVLLRSNGTTVYMTQDLGTALSRFDEYDLDRMVYVVGNEQDYHFQVLFGVLNTLRPGLGERLVHLSYGMVNLPDGKMKTRTGNVVDADELLDAMVELALQETRSRYANVDEDELQRRARSIGLAALKFYILDFNPKTTVQFDPKKSIDFQGRTGPYLLYSYARINSIAREAGGFPTLGPTGQEKALRALGTPLEMAVIRELQEWPRMLDLAARLQDPSKITEQLFKIAKAFSTMYNDRAGHKIIEIESPRREGLLLLARAVQYALASGLNLLGIEPLSEM